MEKTEESCSLLCKCGQPCRKGQRDCRVCHNRSVVRSRKLHREDLNHFREEVNRMSLYRDRHTRQRFEAKIDTYRVFVLTGDARSDYAALPVGFMPNDLVVVSDEGGTLHEVELKNITRYGIKRSK